MNNILDAGSVPSRAVFIDRDDTISIDVSYCSRPEDFALRSQAGPAIKKLNKAGFKVVVVTNQSGVGRGYFTEEILQKIHQKMIADLSAEGATLDAVYYCPHHPDEDCPCRKPAPGMIFRAASELGINLRESFVVGDSERDIQAGKAAGCRTVLVTNHTVGQQITPAPDYITDDLLEAVRWIMKNV